MADLVYQQHSVDWQATEVERWRPTSFVKDDEAHYIRVLERDSPRFCSAGG